MSLASLEAFLARVHDDPGLQELLADAPDAAAVAAIAQAAGFPVSELDLWQATAVSPDDLAPADPMAPVAEAVQPAAGVIQAEAPANAQANAKAKAPGGRLPDPWLEEEPLTRFVHQAQGDAELRQALASAPDAAAVASIAQAAGYPISEVDLWLASGTTPDELAANLRPPGEEEPRANEGPVEAGSAKDDALSGEEAVLADQAPLADEALSPNEALSEGGRTGVVRPFAGVGPSAAEPPFVVDRATGADRPITGADRSIKSDGPPEAESSPPGPGRSNEEHGFWLEEGPVSADTPSSRRTPWPDEDFSSKEDATAASENDLNPQAAAEELIREFLRQAAADAELRQALASAPDASAVASLAQAAGHPLSELALWLASGAAFEEALAESEPAPPSPADDPLTLFLRAVEVDSDLQIALASAPDPATVAAIARIAGFPLTAADLWAASDAVPQELELELEGWLVDEVVVEELVVEERVILGR
jgi:predicted ribosomally synthesized peptide with nif11-like leader